MSPHLRFARTTRHPEVDMLYMHTCTYMLCTYVVEMRCARLFWREGFLTLGEDGSVRALSKLKFVSRKGRAPVQPYTRSRIPLCGILKGFL